MKTKADKTYRSRSLQAGVHLATRTPNAARLSRAAPDAGVHITPPTAATLSTRRDAIDGSILLAVTGLDIDKTTYGSYTALHLAVALNERMIARALLKAGADVDATTARYETPLHLATASGFSDIESDLLSQGANAKKKDLSDRKASTKKRKEKGVFPPTFTAFTPPTYHRDFFDGRDPLPIDTVGKTPGERYQHMKGKGLVTIEAQKWWHGPSRPTKVLLENLFCV